MADIKQVPEATKKSKAARIKEQAKALYPMLLIKAVEGGRDAMSKVAAAGSAEQLNVMRKQMCSAAASVSITAATEFEAEWSRRRGEFLAD